MKRKIIHRLAGASVMLAACAAAPVFALQTTEQSLPPAANVGDSPAQAEHLAITVSAVQGTVRYRNVDQEPWKPCTAGLVLNEGAEFQTGLHSAVQFQLPPNQTITLDRLGTIKVLQAVKQKDAYKTDVGMKYGRTRYEVQAAGIEHESTVRTPNSTLAVRGTGVSVTDERPFSPQAYRYEGLAEWTSGKRRQILAHGAVTAVGGQAVAETALLQSVVDPNIAFARTPSEVPLVTNLLSRGSVFENNNGKGIPIVRGGTPPTDQQLLPLLPGRLDFVLRWDGPANLNLSVSPNTGAGELLYPATGINSTPSGGLIPFDHRGGKNGGIEIASWTGKFPTGLYFLGVSGISGKPVNYQLDAFLDASRVSIFDPATETQVTTLRGQISAGQQFGGIAPIDTPFFPPTPPPGPGVGQAQVAASTAAIVNARTAKPAHSKSLPSRAVLKPHP